MNSFRLPRDGRGMPALGVRTRLAWCGSPSPLYRTKPHAEIYDVRHLVIDARPVIFFQREPVVPWLEHRHEAARSIRGRTNEIHSP